MISAIELAVNVLTHVELARYYIANSLADNCKISKKIAFYGTSMKLARNEEETHTSDFR